MPKGFFLWSWKKLIKSKCKVWIQEGRGSLFHNLYTNGHPFYSRISFISMLLFFTCSYIRILVDALKRLWFFKDFSLKFMFSFPSHQSYQPGISPGAPCYSGYHWSRCIISGKKKKKKGCGQILRPDSKIAWISLTVGTHMYIYMCIYIFIYVYTYRLI